MTAQQPRRARVVTLRDVAAAAGVSLATASQALSGGGRMTERTRDRVEKVAHDLGYVPNALARGLRTGRTRALGVHHQDAARALNLPYFRDFLAGAIDAAHARDHDVAVLSSNAMEPRRAAPRVDGVIVTDPIADDRRARELMESPLAVVAGEHLPTGLPPSAVVAADHATALLEILRETWSRGARDVLLVAPDENSGWGDLLRATVRDWAARRGVSAWTVETRFGGTPAATVRAIARGVLSREPGVDLVVVAASLDVEPVLDTLRDLGRVPGVDVLVAACTDSPRLADAELPVTAVELPARALGRACAERLIELVEEDGALVEAADAVRTLPATVHHRASTAGVLAR